MPPDKAQGPLVKDVEQALLNKRKRRRKYGEVPYPIAYSSQMADFDIWDHMLLKSHCKNLTYHSFATPPRKALDIGCGSGYWVIEAAKQWQTSFFVGFDISRIQPKLERIEYLRSFSERIQWIHGNFLDGLPFPSESFDFVRISELGLAIPEDEWQHTLGEAHRVLTPGGVLEIIEEDLVFPCASAELQRSVSVSMQPAELHKSKSTTFSDKRQHLPLPLSQNSSLGSIQESGRPKPRISTFLPSFSSSKDPSALASAESRSAPETEIASETEHPQDHTRLKTAWEAMLAKRFLSPKLLSVLPFYLTSASFDAKAHRPLPVPMPPNSGVLPPSLLKTYRSMGALREKDRSIFDGLLDFSPPISIHAMRCESFPVKTPTVLPQRSIPKTPQWDTVHLAKTVNTIKGCKDAIFDEYNQLYFKDALYLLSRTAPSEEDYWNLPPSYLIRASFEVDWRNWEYDMADRIAIRNHLRTHVDWVQAVSEDEAPTHCKWRQRLDCKSEGNEGDPVSGHVVTAYNPNDVCRSLRAFTAYKVTS